jgi:hypothetical protein
MLRRSALTRLASWAAVLALVLRATVPMLAASAAQLRGVAVGSICTVYGVVLPGAAAGSPPGPDHPGHGSDEAHTGDHCGLTALAELGVFDGAAPAIVQKVRVVIALAPPAPCRWADACATWVARRKQGPPALG